MLGGTEVLSNLPLNVPYTIKESGCTLRPGSCVFSGREFSNTYHVNNVGLRDDEVSLNHPQIMKALNIELFFQSPVLGRIFRKLD